MKDICIKQLSYFEIEKETKSTHQWKKRHKQEIKILSGSADRLVMLPASAPSTLSVDLNN